LENRYNSEYTMNLEFFDTVHKAFTSFSRANIYTALPCIITNTSDYGTKQVVDIQPLMGRVWDDGQYHESPQVFDAPVINPACNKGMLSFPLEVGDTVLALFCMRDIEKFSASDRSGSLEPKTPRSHSLTDAVVIPSLFSKINNLSPNVEDIELKYIVEGEIESRITLKKNSDIEIDTTKNIVATAGGSITANAVADVSVTAGGNIAATAEGNITANAKGQIDLSSDGDINITAGGNVNITGSTINLN